MHWIAPSEKDTDYVALEKRLWDAAEQAVPVPRFAETDFNGGRPQGLLGLIFLRFAEVRFAAQRAKLEKASAKGGNGHSPRRGSRVDEPAAYHAEGNRVREELAPSGRSRSHKVGRWQSETFFIAVFRAFLNNLFK